MKEILTLIRFLNDDLRNAIKNEVEGCSPDRQARLFLISEITQGIGIVMGVSLLESMVKQLTNKYPHSGVSGDPSVPTIRDMIHTSASWSTYYHKLDTVIQRNQRQ